MHGRMSLSHCVLCVFVAAATVAGSIATGGEGASGSAARSKKSRPIEHKSISKYEFGRGDRSFWLFEPAEPKPKSAPVIVFHHGWMAYNPGIYGAWIEHLVRRGYIVIFPRYQNDVSTDPAQFLANSLSATKDAFDVLATSPSHVHADRNRFALIGHSAGGNLSALMAAGAKEEGLPEPKAVVAVTPGEVKPLAEDALKDLPSTTLFVVTVGEDDQVLGDTRGRELYARATTIPRERKKFVLFRSDLHGFPPLIADHTSPAASSRKLDTGEAPFRSLQMFDAEVDALDVEGYWKLADVTIEAAFAGKTLDEATDHGKKWIDLGRWGDGVAVTPPIIGDDLASFPRVIHPSGAKIINWFNPWN